MQENNFFGGFFQGNKSPKNTKEPQQKSKYQRLLLLFTVVGVVLYPFTIVGSVPLLIIQTIDKRDKAKHVYDMDYESLLKRRSSLFFGLSFSLFLVNIFSFVFFIPRGYLSSYLLFPFNLLNTALVFDGQTVVALLIGGMGMGSLLISLMSFIEKRKVVSKDDERKKILDSKEYKKRKENKFEESQAFSDEQETRYELALANADFSEYERLMNEFLLGMSEFGFPYIIDFEEFNQHVLIPATTGSGKTTLLQLFIQHAVKYNMPLVLVDGKGSKDTLEAMQVIARFYGKEVRAFTDDGDMRYNPVEHGNDISIRDKLVSLAETESVFYSSAAKALLQVTVQLLDEFKGIKGVERSLPYVQQYLLPRNVLDLFAHVMLKHNPKLFEIEVEVKASKKPKKKENKKTKLLDDLEEPDDNQTDSTEPKDKRFEDIERDEEQVPETEIVVLNPKTLDLESYYFLLKRNLYYLLTDDGDVDKQKKILFERLFIRYEHKTSPFYLYATSEALQTNLNMLLDSELGKLFDTKGAKNTLDIQEIARKNDIVYVSLNGLIYKEFIRTLAQMLVGDINYFASEMYRKSQSKGILTIFDEPASYLNESFIDMVNKGRGAGIHAVYSPQTMADIAKLGDKLMEQLVGNVNTLIIGKTNEATEAEYWSNTIGTYEDIDVTSMIEQEEGFSDVGKTDWTGERGTKRNVDRFKVNPNRFKALRTGEFIVYRSAKNIDVPPQLVYVRNVLKWLEKNKK